MNRSVSRVSRLLTAASLTILMVLPADVSRVSAGGTATSGLVPLRLQLKWLPQAQFAGYFAAQAQGYYREAGLNVSILPGGPDIAPESVVNSGKADIGIDWLSALLVARDSGMPLQNIAQIFQASGMRMIAFKSTGIRSVQDLRGKRVGLWGNGNQYQFYALMSKSQLSPPSRYMTIVPQGFTMKEFFSRTVTVAHVMTYNELNSVYEGGVKPSELTIFDYNKLGVGILEDGIFAQQSWLAAHPDLAVRFLHASIRGWEWAVMHPVAAGKLSFRLAPRGSTTLQHQIDMASQVAKLIAYGPGLQHAIGYMNPVEYARAWHTLMEEHVIKHAPTGAFTQTYWKEAGGF